MTREKRAKKTDDHGKCKSCGACKECGAPPAPVPMPVYVTVYVQPVQPAPVVHIYPRWDGPIWQVFPNTTGGFVTSGSTGFTIDSFPPVTVS